MSLEEKDAGKSEDGFEKEGRRKDGQRDDEGDEAMMVLISLTKNENTMSFDTGDISAIVERQRIMAELAKICHPPLLMREQCNFNRHCNV